MRGGPADAGHDEPGAGGPVMHLRQEAQFERLIRQVGALEKRIVELEVTPEKRLQMVVMELLERIAFVSVEFRHSKDLTPEAAADRVNQMAELRQEFPDIDELLPPVPDGA